MYRTNFVIGTDLKTKVKLGFNFQKNTARLLEWPI